MRSSLVVLPLLLAACDASVPSAPDAATSIDASIGNPAPDAASAADADPQGGLAIEYVRVLPGYDTVEACDGKNALSKLDGRKLHLIISDVNMPNMDGLSFVRAAKQLPAYKFTPVIMLTTEVSDAKKQEGQAAGAKAWVVKPFQPAQMLAAVSKLVLP